MSRPIREQGPHDRIRGLSFSRRQLEHRPAAAASASSGPFPYMQMSAGVNMGTITASTYNDGVEGDQWVWNDEGAEFFEELSPGTIDHGIRILAHDLGGLYHVRCHLGVFRDAGTAGNYPRWVRLDLSAVGFGMSHYENSTAVTGGADTPLELEISTMLLVPESPAAGSTTDLVPQIRVIDGADDYLFRLYMHVYRLGASGYTGTHDNTSP